MKESCFSSDADSSGKTLAKAGNPRIEDGSEVRCSQADNEADG